MTDHSGYDYEGLPKTTEEAVKMRGLVYNNATDFAFRHEVEYLRAKRRMETDYKRAINA